MAIDEKKLIDDVWKYALTCKNTSFEFVRRMRDIEKIINKQPKLSLENKTSDNDAPDNNVEKMIREFERLEVAYFPDEFCLYPEYIGKPYFAIRYKENGNHFLGYGTYSPEVLSRYLRDYFMPLAMPKESKWIPFKMRKANEEERENFGCDEVLDCQLPDENQEILVSGRNGYVGIDTFMYDDGGWYLESGNDFVTDAVAWMPKPEAYKGE